jgi:hypothetical protein
VQQYYKIKSEQSADVYKFYAEDGVFSYYTGDAGDASAHVGLSAIHDAVKQLDLTGAQFDLTHGSVDAQFSGGEDGILLIVTGLYTPRSDTTKNPFFNSFFLSKQNKEKTSYFVRNSVFRALGHELLQGASKAPGKTMESAGVSTFSTASFGNGVSDGVPKSAPETVAVAATTEKKEEKKEKVKNNTKKEEGASASPVAAAAAVEPVPAADDAAPAPVPATVPAAAKTPSPKQGEGETKSSTPKSWASMVATSRPTPAPVPKPKPTAVVTASPKAPAAATANATSDSENVEEKGSRPTFSIYVKGINEQVKKEELVALFSKFGEVANVQVFSTGFAFVDFESQAGLDAALDKKNEASLSVKNCKLRAEKRKSASAGGAGKNGGGRRGERGEGGGDKKEGGGRASGSRVNAESKSSWAPGNSKEGSTKSSGQQQRKKKV